MKFTTYLRAGAPRLALVDGAELIDLNDAQPQVPADLRLALKSGVDLIAAVRAAVADQAATGSVLELPYRAPRPLDPHEVPGGVVRESLDVAVSPDRAEEALGGIIDVRRIPPATFRDRRQGAGLVVLEGPLGGSRPASIRRPADQACLRPAHLLRRGTSARASAGPGQPLSVSYCGLSGRRCGGGPGPEFVRH